mgnify:FL=1
MLQRIQTFYLFLSALCSGVLYFIFPLSIIESKPYFAQERSEFLALFIASTLLAVVAIFKFKSRQTQFVLGRLNILLNLILLGLFIYRLFNLPTQLQNFEKGPAMFLPIISVVLLALANKAIKKDEALIKSVDRLR